MVIGRVSEYSMLAHEPLDIIFKIVPYLCLVTANGLKRCLNHFQSVPGVSSKRAQRLIVFYLLIFFILHGDTLLRTVCR